MLIYLLQYFLHLHYQLKILFYNQMFHYCFSPSFSSESLKSLIRLSFPSNKVCLRISPLIIFYLSSYFPKIEYDYLYKLLRFLKQKPKNIPKILHLHDVVLLSLYFCSYHYNNLHFNHFFKNDSFFSKWDFLQTHLSLSSSGSNFSFEKLIDGTLIILVFD